MQKGHYSKECIYEKLVYQKKSDKRETIGVYRKKSDKRETNQQDDKLEQVLYDYEEEKLSEIEAYTADSQEEYEEETDLLPLIYNLWNEENSVYLTLKFKKEFEPNLA
ncbi:14712_t:CDS:2, partial [Funneliformis caledonium]